MTKRAKLTKDYKYWKAGTTLGFPEKLYEQLKEEGYFKVKKVTRKKENED
jgi:hypothetical protein